MKYLFLAIVLLFPSIVTADVTDVLESICHICGIADAKELPGIGGGTGFVFGEDKDHYFIMTAGHVMGKHKGVWVEFFINGVRSERVAAYLVGVEHNGKVSGDIRDLAVLSLAKKDLKFIPKITPLAPARPLAPKEQIVTGGCPNGAWPSAQLGHVVEDRGVTFAFRPNAVPGRSGSPVVNKAGTHVLGVVILYNDASDVATAVSLDGIKKHVLTLEGVVARD